MVYATNRKLPRMDELSHVPTRELNGFEAGALESLAKGEELAYAPQGKSVLALGALRARDTCTKCHEVDRGALLGAFSYEFLGNATPAGKSPPPQAADLRPLPLSAFSRRIRLDMVGGGLP